jgi:hypothetical protein
MGRIFPLRQTLKTFQNKALKHLDLLKQIGGSYGAFMAIGDYRGSLFCCRRDYAYLPE